MASCLGIAGLLGSIASGATGVFGTIRGLLPGGSRKREDVRIRNQNRRSSTTNNTNSHNRNRTSVETMNYFRNEYHTQTGGHCQDCGSHRVDLEGLEDGGELHVSSMPPMLQGLEGKVLPED
jgi:hypothetical protein